MGWSEKLRRLTAPFRSQKKALRVKKARFARVTDLCSRKICGPTPVARNTLWMVELIQVDACCDDG
jgi:hypothetical protein